MSDNDERGTMYLDELIKCRDMAEKEYQKEAKKYGTDAYDNAEANYWAGARTAYNIAIEKYRLVDAQHMQAL